MFTLSCHVLLLLSTCLAAATAAAAAGGKHVVTVGGALHVRKSRSRSTRIRCISVVTSRGLRHTLLLFTMWCRVLLLLLLLLLRGGVDAVLFKELAPRPAVLLHFTQHPLQQSMALKLLRGR